MLLLHVCVVLLVRVCVLLHVCQLLRVCVHVLAAATCVMGMCMLCDQHTTVLELMQRGATTSMTATRTVSQLLQPSLSMVATHSDKSYNHVLGIVVTHSPVML